MTTCYTVWIGNQLYTDRDTLEEAQQVADEMKHHKDVTIRKDGELVTTTAEKIEELTHDRMIELIEADRSGKKFQRRTSPLDDWEDFTMNRDFPYPFNFWTYQYRIKPEPREIWVNEYKFGLACEWFSRKEDADVNSKPGRNRRIKFREVLDD